MGDMDSLKSACALRHRVQSEGAADQESELELRRPLPSR